MENLYKTLAEYVDWPERLVRTRCRYAGFELAWQWQRYDEPLAFYQETDLYIFDLTRYQMQHRREGVHAWLRDQIREHDWHTVLDFGGGIAEWALIAAREGCAAWYHDLLGSVTWAYAMWRLGREDAGARVVAEPDAEAALARDYDAIFAMDIFEHLEDPQPVVDAMAEHTEWLIANPAHVLYGEEFPQHISRYQLEPAFEHVDGYLWRRASE